MHIRACVCGVSFQKAMSGYLYCSPSRTACEVLFVHFGWLVFKQEEKQNDKPKGCRSFPKSVAQRERD